MKKNYYFKSLFRTSLVALCLMTVGVGNAWGNYAYFYPSDNKWYNDDAKFTVSFSDPSYDFCDGEEISGSGVWRFNINERTGTAYFKRRHKDACNGNWNQVSGTVDASHNVMKATSLSEGSMQSYVINYIHGTNHVYFDNSVSNFPNNIYLLIGHDYSPTGGSSTYTKAYKMSSVTGTKLFHVEVTDTWQDATYYAIIADDAESISATAWGSSDIGKTDKGDKGYTAAYKTVYNMEGGSYLITTASSGNNKTMTITYYDGYNNLPKVNASQAAKWRDTGTSYSITTGSWPATLKLKGSYMNNATDTARSTITSTASTDDAGNKTYGAIKTGEITHSYTSLSGYHFEGWGTGSTPSNTAASYSYNITAATTVYAFFSKLYTLSYATKGDDTGSSVSVYSVDGFSGSTTSGSSIPTGHLITLVATPATGYEVKGWYSDTSCETAYTNGSGGVTIEDGGNTFKLASLNANSGVYPKFGPKNYTINLENMEATTPGTTSVSVTYNASTNMTASDPITKPTKDGYTFGGYYTSENTGATLDDQLIDADGKWIADVTGYTSNDGAGNPTWVHDYAISLYAMWTEDTHSVNVAVSPAGAGSVQVNSSNVTSVSGVGIATQSAEMTPIAAAGWKFKEWQVTSNVQMDLTNYHSDYQQGTANKMRINATADDQTITAVYEPRYYLVGGEITGPDDGGSGTSSGMPGWTNYTDTFKIISNSPSFLATCSLTLGHDKNYFIMVRDKVDGLSYGKADTHLGDNTSFVFDTRDVKVTFQSNGGDNYTFKITDVDGSGRPTVSVERPYQVNFGRRRVDIDGTAYDDNTGGTLVVDTTSTAISTGAWIPYGKTVQYTTNPVSGYTQTWYTSSDYSSTFVAGGVWSHSLTSTDNCYAQFTEKATTVTLANDGNGKVQISSTDKTNTTCGVTTTRELTAVPNDGYMFSSWTKTSGSDYDLSTTSAATTTLTGAGGGESSGQTVTANFALRWALKAESDGWGSASFDIDNISTIGGDAMGYVDISLAANTNYQFTIIDKQGSGATYKNGSDHVYYMTNGNSYVWDFSTSKTYNCGITTAGAGTYRFMWNITDKTMSVIYPNFVIYRSGDKSDDPRATEDDVESYDGGTISKAIEFRMKVRDLDMWYTLCLPFIVNAVKVWDEEDGQYYAIEPYYRTEVGATLNGGHYIIRKPKQTIDLPISDFGDWRDPTSATDYVPTKDTAYIIQWHNSYFLNKYVSFFGATGQTIPTSFTAGAAPSVDNVVNVHGNNSMQSGSVAGAYLFEADYGNGAWLRSENVNEARTINPFECYVRASSGTTGRFLVIRRGMTIEDTATGWDDVLNSETKEHILVYSLSGICVTQLHDCSLTEAGQRLSESLSEGLYILYAGNESVKLMVGGK